MPQPELIVVADEQGRSAFPAIAGMSVTMIDWRNTGALSSIGDVPIIIDIDLRNNAKVAQLSAHLDKRAGKPCRIVAVERANHLSEIQANSLGASDLLRRPFGVLQVLTCLRHHAVPGVPDDDAARDAQQDALKREPGGTSVVAAALALDRIFAGLACGRPVELASLQNAGEQVMTAFSEVGLETWLGTVRRYHESTFQHCLIVTGILTAFGHGTGMRHEDILTLTIAGLLHDVGKARVPVGILDKPGPLTSDEFAILKQHPTTGYDYLSAQNIFSSETLHAVRHHHEYLDGSGYPDGLPAQRIDDLTRIVTICDIYGAMLERRAYKEPATSEASLDILRAMARDGKVEHNLVRALRCVVAA